MIRIKDNRGKILYSLAVLLLSVFSAWVFWNVQKGIVSSHEELVALTLQFLEQEKGGAYRLHGLYGWGIRGAIRLFGISYNAQRIAWSWMYFVVAALTLDLSLRDNEWNINYNAIPIYIVLMVFIHLTGNYVTEYFGNEYGDWVFTNYPFVLHIYSLVAALFCVWCVDRIHKCTSIYETKKFRLAMCIVLCAFSTIIATFGELAFLILLIYVPIFLVCFRDWIFEKKIRSRIIFGTGIAGVLLYIVMMGLGSRLPSKIYNLLMLLQHKELSFKGLAEFRQQFTYYVNCLLATFNADLYVENIDMLTKWVYFARSIMIIFIVVEIYHQIGLYFKKDQEVDVVDQILAWGALGVSLGFIFTSIGNWGETKYLSFMLPYGTIILCRHLDKFLRATRLKSATSLWIIFGLIFAISYDREWNVEVVSAETERLTSLLSDMDVKEGVSSNYLAPKISVGSNGDIWAYSILYDGTTQQFAYAQQFDSSDTILNYFIYTNAGYYGGDPFTVDDIILVHGTPEVVVKDGETSCLVYRQGVSLGSRYQYENNGTRYMTRYYSLGLMYGDNYIERNDSDVTIYSGGQQRGPFISLQENTYQLWVTAKNFDASSFHIVGQVEGECQEIPYQLLELTDERALIQFEMHSSADSVEFQITNETDTPIILESYYLEEL